MAESAGPAKRPMSSQTGVKDNRKGQSFPIRQSLSRARLERCLRKQGCALSLTASPAFKYAHDLGPGQRVPERSLKYLAVLLGKFL